MYVGQCARMRRCVVQPTQASRSQAATIALRSICAGVVSRPLIGSETPAASAHLAYRVRQLSVLARPVPILAVRALKPLTMRVALAVRIAPSHLWMVSQALGAEAPLGNTLVRV